MIARLKRLLWFNWVTCWSAMVGVFCFAYLAIEGPSTVAIVRAVVGGGVLLFVGMVLATRAYYAAANRQARDPDRGALPRHVALISRSYSLALIFIAVEIWTRAGHPLTWRIPLAALIAVDGARALASLIEFERRRVYFVSPFVTDLRGSPHDDRRR